MSAMEAPSECPTSSGRSMWNSIQQRRQDVERLLVHEAWRARGDQPIRLPVAEAGIEQCARAEPPGELVREVAPQGHRAQAFVQEHQRGLGVVARDHAVFDLAAGYGGEGHAGWRSCGCG